MAVSSQLGCKSNGNISLQLYKCCCMCVYVCVCDSLCCAANNLSFCLPIVRTAAATSSRYRVAPKMRGQYAQPVAPERIWKWGAPVQRKVLEKLLFVPLHFFGYWSTISRFGERFRDGQYSLVSFFFAVLLLMVPPCPAICNSKGHVPPCPIKLAPLCATLQKWLKTVCLWCF